MRNLVVTETLFPQILGITEKNFIALISLKAHIFDLRNLLRCAFLCILHFYYFNILSNYINTEICKQYDKNIFLLNEVSIQWFPKMFVHFKIL